MTGLPFNRRIYVFVRSGGPGRTLFHMTDVPPETVEQVPSFMWRGMLPFDGPVDLQFVSDPASDPTLRGPAGKDGTNGKDGKNGIDGTNGASAYAIAVAAGFTGTQAQWLASLKATVVLGQITVAQTATIAIAAGARRLTITVPAALGVKAGDALMFCPSSALAGYVFGDVVAVSATSLSIGLTGPVLAIGAQFTVSGPLIRFG